MNEFMSYLFTALSGMFVGVVTYSHFHQPIDQNLDCIQQGQIVSKSYTTDSKGDKVLLTRTSQGCVLYKAKGAE